VVTAGSGAPLVMLHGWPETWYAWRKLIPLLAERYRMIMPDLPGLGESSRPPSYDKKSIGADLGEMCAELGLDCFHLVGHDWGGPSAFALACAIPQAVKTLSVLDVTIPGIGPDISQGGRRWHHAFHMTPELPEALTAGREREYLGWFYREFSWQRDAIAPADLVEYLRSYGKPGAMRSGFEYYRTLPLDKEHNRAILDSGWRLPMPVLALGGARTEARGRGEEPLESLRAIASNVTGGAIADCGHFIAEEQPEILAERLLGHFAG